MNLAVALAHAYRLTINHSLFIVRQKVTIIMQVLFRLCYNYIYFLSDSLNLIDIYIQMTRVNISKMHVVW